MSNDTTRAKQTTAIIGGNAVALTLAGAACWAYFHTSQEREGLYLYYLIMAGAFLGSGLIGFFLKHPWRGKKIRLALLTPGILMSLIFILVFKPGGFWSESSLLWLAPMAALTASFMGVLGGHHIKKHLEERKQESPWRPFIKDFRAVMAGFLTGAIFLIIVIIPIAPMGHEGTAVLPFVLVMAIALSGFVSGWSFCQYTQANGKLKPLMLFLCTPAFFMLSITFGVSSLGALFSGQPFIILQLFIGCFSVMLLSWFGALLGWGVHKRTSGILNNRKSNQCINKG